MKKRKPPTTHIRVYVSDRAKIKSLQRAFQIKSEAELVHKLLRRKK